MKTARKARGFSLMEVLFAMVIFVALVGGMGRFFLGTGNLNEGSRNLTRAMEDARTVCEAIRNTSMGGLAAVTAVNWAAWATQNGLTTLPNQQVTVTFTNPAANPLPVRVVVSWQDRRHPRTATVETLVTQR